MIVIVDVGLGNVGSIFNMLRRKCGTTASISSNVKDVEKASRIILPGVGSFDQGMYGLRQYKMVDVLKYKVGECKVPLLSICLGLQLLSERSEEGNQPGLGLIRGETVKFSFKKNGENLKIPHMGWNTLNIQKDSIFFERSNDKPRFYFVHSYHLTCHDESSTLSTTFYGYEFVSAILQENIIGVQFHPEKSHKFGARFFDNFVRNF